MVRPGYDNGETFHHEWVHGRRTERHRCTHRFRDSVPDPNALFRTFPLRLRPKLQTTWTDPTITAIQQPPPPPPPEPEKKAENKLEKREQDQWFRINDPKKGRVWYNEKTEKKQDGRPQCLFKYR